jgi:hypothetical protein
MNEGRPIHREQVISEWQRAIHTSVLLVAAVLILFVLCWAVAALAVYLHRPTDEALPMPAESPPPANVVVAPLHRGSWAG